MSVKVFVFCFSALVPALSTSAYADGVICTISDRSNAFYIAPEISVSFQDYNEVSIRDSIVAKSGKKLVIGQVLRETARALSLVWEVRNIPADPGEFRASKPKLRVRLDIHKADGGATIKVSDLVQTNLVYRGTGTCRPDG